MQKTSTLFEKLFLVFSCLLSLKASSQTNTFPTSGNAGIGTLSPATTLQVVGTSRLGGGTDYAQFATDGDLTFTSFADYLVGGDRYAFRYSGNQNTGIFFSATNGRYEFRDGAAIANAFITSTGSFYAKSKIGINNTAPAAMLDITPTSANAFRIAPFGTSAGNTGEMRLIELAANGTNHVGFKAPDAIGSNKIWTLPSADGASGQMLSTNGSGVLSWTSGTSYTAGAGIGIAGSVISNTGDLNPVDDASLSLSNLTATSVNQPLVPNANNSFDLGSPANSWKDFYADGDIFMNDLRFLSNGTATSNTFVGTEAGLSNTSGVNNTFVGQQAGYSNTTTSNSSFFGRKAGYSNTDGSNNCFFGEATGSNNTVGNENSFYGRQSGNDNITGSGNTFVGYQSGKANKASDNSFYGRTSGFSNTMGTYNSFFGKSAGYSNTTGNHNSFFGEGAGYSNSTADYNSFFGNAAGYFNTTGYNNSFFGQAAGNSNSTGYSNSFFGKLSGYSNTTANSNSFFGEGCGYFNSTGEQNSFFGQASGYFNTTGSSNSFFGQTAGNSNTTASNNSFFGNSAGLSNTTGNDNSFFGKSAGQLNATGYSNSFFGMDAGYFNTIGQENSFFGQASGYDNTSGSSNSFYGFEAGENNSTGSFDSYFGENAGSANNTGNFNSFFGCFAGADNTYGILNTFIGYLAGITNQGGEKNTCIGGFANMDVTCCYENTTAIGYDALVDNFDRVRIGNSAVVSIGGYAGWSNVSDGRFKKNVKTDVPGLSFINKLVPVTYNLDATGIKQSSKSIGAPLDESYLASLRRKEEIVYSGFIAQDVEAAAKEIGYDFSGVDKPQNENSLYGLRYAEFVVPLVKAVQELSSEDERQNEAVTRQESRIKTLEEENKTLKSEIENLKSIMTSSSKMNDGTVKLQTSNSEPKTALLGQNVPNPFDNSTLIPFRLPKDCNDASIMIVETATGRVVAVIPITCNETHVQIDAGTLASGNYHYSLYVDGNLIGSNEMVIMR